ncbi:tetratricopeptide repeat protein [Herpetosiphon gulosus]|uniref:Tetratricopeptide repeat protein n=1 Tax=Herpetosiphon gulosus TaxID=1973496 RepID=A0ABP9WU29_9CHLR
MADKFRQAELHYRRGLSLEHAGRIAEAVEEYRQALQENPQLRAAHVALAKYYLRNGLLAKAADAWHAVVAIEPDYEALTNYATVLIELKHYHEARQILRLCVELFPLDTFVTYELAYIDFAEGLYQQALDQLLDVRPIYNDEWEFHELIGQCQIKLQLYDAALASFGRAILLVDDDEQIEQLQDLGSIARRYQEFSLVSNEKDAWYATHGLICLGSNLDDGLNLKPHAEFAWSFEAIATTLQRAAALAEVHVWCCDQVLAFDTQSKPLAQALAQLLQRPYIQKIGDPEKITLVVMAEFEQSAMLEAIAEQLDGLHCIFALSMRSSPDVLDDIPDLIGLPIQKPSLPWTSQSIATATKTLLATLAQLTPEPNREQQLDYYREQHRLIRLND